MTAATIDTTARPSIELASLPRIPLSRLVRVELRKLANTRSGKWLLIAIGALTLLIIGIVLVAAKESDRTYFNFMGAASTPQGFLLPVMGILLITSEWTQRTALVSFTLMPVRGRVLFAKVLAGLIASAAAITLTVAVATLATLVGGVDNAWAGVGSDFLGKFALLQVSGVLMGMAFGLLFLNSSAAIVTYFVLPGAFALLSSLWNALDEVRPWVDLWTSQQPLFTPGNVTNAEWFQLATGTTIWVVLPFVLGVVRVLRAEVK
jgi:ABC-2 type transport system permease protein